MFLIIPLHVGITGLRDLASCFSCFRYLARRFWNQTWKIQGETVNREVYLGAVVNCAVARRGVGQGGGGLRPLQNKCKMQWKANQ